MSGSVRQITSIEDAISLVRWSETKLADLNGNLTGYRDIFPKYTWFRGQANSSWLLVPTAFRRYDNDKGQLLYGEHETGLVRNFKLHLAYSNEGMQDTFDWLCLMQHHGCPTRILDWSENILTALYFAVQEDLENDDLPGALFALNSLKLNYHTSPDANNGCTILRAGDLPVWIRAEIAEFASRDALVCRLNDERPSGVTKVRASIKGDAHKFTKYLSRPVAVHPRYIHPRLLRQQSAFVLHGGSYACTDESLSRPILLEELNETVTHFQFLEKFEIAAEKKATIRKDLQALGIHVASLFPELEYQAKFIRDEVRIPRDAFRTPRSRPRQP